MIIPGDFMWLTHDIVIYSTYDERGQVTKDMFRRKEGPFLVIQVVRERVDERTNAEALVLASSGQLGWVEHAYLQNEPKKKRRARCRKVGKAITWK